jgi:hypothetical protein
MNMNRIKEEMLRIKADGVVFYTIGTTIEDLAKYPERVHCEYTLESIENATIIPRSGSAFYKLFDGKRCYYDTTTQQYIRDRKLNVQIVATRVEVSCINCCKDYTINMAENTIGEEKFARLGRMAMDFNCDMCDCNTFEAKLFYALKVCSK